MANPHAPRNDAPFNEENWLHPTLQAKYTSATKVEGQLKTDPISPKQKTCLGEIS